MIRIDDDAAANQFEIDMRRLRSHGVDTGRIEAEPDGTYRLTSTDGTWIAFGPDAEGGWDLTVYDPPTDDESGVEVIAQDYAPNDAELAANAEGPRVNPVSVQLADALTAGVTDWCGLLGLDLLPELTARAEAAAGRIAAELTGEDRTAAARTAADLIGILGEPDDAAQWATPLWAAIGRALGDDPERPGFSRSQAAAVLGVKQGTVSQWEHRGTIDIGVGSGDPWWQRMYFGGRHRTYAQLEAGAHRVLTAEWPPAP